MADKTKRGRLFENLVADLFRANHFDVRLNAGVARPRQTDLLATRAAEVYLIECKWRSARADIDAIDSLRARLRRTSGAIGLMIGMAGFSGTAISEVADHREQPVLLLSGDELRRVVDRPAALLDLLWRKGESLRVDGQALVDEPARRQPRRKPLTLPDSPTRFVSPAHQHMSLIETGGGFGQLTFTHDLVDIDWVAASGSGVTLDVPVPVLSERGVLDLLDKLASLGWASSDARWSIHQSTTSWHGFGAAAFAAELPQWKQRADRPNSHHSEEFCYLDSCTGGFYTLTSSISAERTRWATQTVLSFQLQGIPLDVAPLLQLCRAIGIHDNLHFRPLTARSTRTVHLPDWMTSSVEPGAHIVTPGTDIDPHPEWVTGVVLPNPLRQSRWRSDPLRAKADLYDLEVPESLICHLGDFHPTNDGRKYTYRLQRIEKTRTSEGIVYRPVARWDFAHDEEATDISPD
ncbi:MULTISPECIES: restriction endonuclease [Micromonospora]|uniref:restriction endonuclease n=1 Tax=Micromonospora TaxID=1873 RepID=UPI0007C85CF3|nr:restriction endonuclease [Micromonospora haikouensis]